MGVKAQPSQSLGFHFFSNSGDGHHCVQMPTKLSVNKHLLNVQHVKYHGGLFSGWSQGSIWQQNGPTSVVLVPGSTLPFGLCSSQTLNSSFAGL